MQKFSDIIKNNNYNQLTIHTIKKNNKILIFSDNDHNNIDKTLEKNFNTIFKLYSKKKSIQTNLLIELPYYYNHKKSIKLLNKKYKDNKSINLKNSCKIYINNFSIKFNGITFCDIRKMKNKKFIKNL